MSISPAPGIPQFTAGYGPQQPDFTAWWTNAAAFFQSKVVFRGIQGSTTTSVPGAGGTVVIGIDTVLEDPYGGWSASGTAWTAPVSGWYQATLTIQGAAGSNSVTLRPAISAGKYQQVEIKTLSLADVPVPNSAAGGAEGTFTAYLVAGQDAIQALASVQGAGGGFTTGDTTGQQSSLEIMWVSS